MLNNYLILFNCIARMDVVSLEGVNNVDTPWLLRPKEWSANHLFTAVFYYLKAF